MLYILVRVYQDYKDATALFAFTDKVEAEKAQMWYMTNKNDGFCMYKINEVKLV